jgi:carboxypeptidase Taq
MQELWVFMKSYRKLEDIFKRVRDLEDVVRLLEWDLAILMPVKSLKYRSNQIIVLKELIHSILIDSALGDLISAAKVEELTPKQKARLHEMYLLHKNVAVIPVCLMKDFSETSSECRVIWKEAREENNYNKLLPCFKRLVEIVRDIASIRAQKLKINSYDALINLYSPACSSGQMDAIFAKLGPFIRDFLKEVAAYQKKQKIYKIYKNIYPVDKQREVIFDCIEALGFDFSRGRVDRSIHPFFTSIANEVRITTKYYENNFFDSLRCTMHEVGHAIYEINLSDEYYSRPYSSDIAAHESVASLFGTQICQSEEFINFIRPMFKKAFDGRGKAWEVDNLHRLITGVNPALVRINSDEISYMAHVMLRYSLEKEIINGSLKIEDLPKAWEDGMKHYFGIAPKNGQDGCMQDIHWFSGVFGYFPIYAVAAVAAPQIFSALKNNFPNILPKIAQGNFTDLLSWLKKDICGHEYPGVLKKVTGKDLNIEDYMSYLRGKYLGES